MKTISISDQTWEKIKDQVLEEDDTALEINELDEFIGKKIFIRTVTYHLVGEVLVGEVKNRIGNLFELKGASWVADSGRFMNALKDGFSDSAEIEPVGQCYVNIETIIDMFPWKHDLPTEQK